MSSARTPRNFLRMSIVVPLLVIYLTACGTASPYRQGETESNAIRESGVRQVPSTATKQPSATPSETSGRERARQRLAARHEKQFRKVDNSVARDLWENESPWMPYNDFSVLVVDACDVLKRYDYNLLFATDLRNDTLENTAARVVWFHARFGGLTEAYCAWHEQGPSPLPTATPNPTPKYALAPRTQTPRPLWLASPSPTFTPTPRPSPTPTPKPAIEFGTILEPCGNSRTPDCTFHTIHIGSTLDLDIFLERQAGTVELEYLRYDPDSQVSPFCEYETGRKHTKYLLEGADVHSLHFRTCGEGLATFHLRLEDGREGYLEVEILPK